MHSSYRLPFSILGRTNAMLGPDSRLLVVAFLGASVALLAGLVQFRILPIRLLCGALSIVMAMIGGVAVVNDYYGYYTTWSQLWADLQGSAGNLGVISAEASTASAESGSLRWVDMPGKLSGYNRKALVYLPPQYNQPRYAHTRFPVVELFHGSPGIPLAWETALHIDQIANALVSEHLMGPMVLVMPSINGAGNDYQDCVNSPTANDETYLVKDIRADVLARYRVSADPAEWGLGGYSSGGYCAANLALRDPATFGAAAVINGYFRATDGPAAQALQNNPALEYANSPLYQAERLSPGTSPLPAFWVAAGISDRTDYPAAVAFTAALDRIEQVPFTKYNSGDSAKAWDAVLPTALSWLWQQVATPDLKVTFPARAMGNSQRTVWLPPVKRRPPVTPCKIGRTCVGPEFTASLSSKHTL
jgi:enterochelin esterase-like enzyme